MQVAAVHCTNILAEGLRIVHSGPSSLFVANSYDTFQQRRTGAAPRSDVVLSVSSGQSGESRVTMRLNADVV